MVLSTVSNRKWLSPVNGHAEDPVRHAELHIHPDGLGQREAGTRDGVALPVTKRSGKRRWVHWRWQCPTFVRQTFVEWAGQTINKS